MAANLTDYTRRLLFLFLLSFACLNGVAQKNISDNIGQPFAHVSAILADRVTVDDVAGFAAGDTILMIQMQGVGIITNPGVYGNYQNSYGQPGMHEFLIIQSVSAPSTIIFRNNILKPFDAGENVQIVRVPYYNSAVVTSRLFCDPWNSSTGKGGVLVLIAGSSLTLEGDIDVSGLGLRGALPVSGEGRCQDAAPATNGTSYPVSFLNAGIKGEGISIHDDSKLPLYPAHAKGQGPDYTGGGGGNGRYSGGGGGSNRGEGGIGGYEDPACPAPQKGGWKGKKIGPELADRIFAGGGGGSATSLSGTTGQGGNGGGIVIIVTDDLISAGGRILADGGAGGDGSSSGGAGGGGGGGSIALSVSVYKTPVLLSATGGRGGNNASPFGTGGGGGGGLVYINRPEATVTSEFNGGNAGNPINAGAAAGTPGERKEDFKVQLNGFLFNSIRSSVTGNQVDSICSDTEVALLTGTTPVGGTAPYTYTWQKSYDQSSWITLVSNTTAINYNPGVIETTTVYYRRIITDSSLPVFTDISKPVQVIVQPFIKNNTIGSDDIICFAQDPDEIVSTGILADGNGIYTFGWEVSTDNVTYGVPANTHNTESYTPPPALQADSWYRRTVYSGRCVNTSAPVSIDVLNNITNNQILNTPPEICFGMAFENLLGSTPATAVVLSGGDNTYRYRWESNINNNGWTAAAGTFNQPNHDPAEQTEAIAQNDYLFRRVVYSGAGDVCSSVSNVVALRDYSRITNNAVTADQVLCQGSTPAQLSGSAPGRGNGIYTYIWQDSTGQHTWTDIPGAVSQNYAPPSLTETTRYRRVVNSSACSDISKSVRMTVHTTVTGNTVTVLSGGADTTICYNLVPFRLRGSEPSGGTGIAGDWAYQWQSSSDNVTFSPVAVNGTTKDYQPAALASTTYYRRQATSGACSSFTATVVTVNVLPQLTNNTVSADQTICYNTLPSAFTGSMPAGGQTGSYAYLWEQSPDGTSWVPASGTNNTINYTSPALTLQRLYRRRVTSGLAGTCVNVSAPVTISIHPPLPTGVIINNADTTICGEKQVQLKVRLTGSGPWKVTYADNSADGQETDATAAQALFSLTPASPLAVNNHLFTLTRIEDTNGCLAVSLSGSKRATVYRVPVPNAGRDTAVCGPSVTLHAIPSVGTGLWTFPPAAITAASVNPTVRVSIDSSLFSGGKLTSRFYWQETNWQCVRKDSVDITFHKRIASINAGPDEVFYSAYREYQLKNDPPEQWETGTWQVEKGTGNFIPGRVTGISEGLNTYRWTITNGLMNGNVMTAGCSRSDLLNLQVYPLQIPEGFSPDNDGEGYNNTFEIRGLNLEDNTVELRIINGAGVEVFSAKSVQGGGGDWREWDGKNKKGIDVPEGTYYYVLKIHPVGLSEPQKPAQRSGFIILKRD